MNSDYRDFLEGSPIAPPLELTNKVMTSVRRDLSPSAWNVFLKLFAIHAMTTVLTLSVCPQFGLRLFGEGHGLMGYFMPLGLAGCMVACGFFFLGTSLIVASILLRPEQLRVIRQKRWAEIGSLAGLSLVFFAMVNPGILWGTAMYWLIGAIGGGFLIGELGWRLRAPRLAS